MQRAKTQTKGPSPFEVLERRCIEGAIVEESRRGEKEKNPFFPPSHSLLLLAFITLDLLNWNFDPIKLCLHLADMGSQPAIPSFTTTDALSLSLPLQTVHIGVGSRCQLPPTGAKLEGSLLVSDRPTPKSFALPASLA